MSTYNSEIVAFEERKLQELKKGLSENVAAEAERRAIQDADSMLRGEFEDLCEKFIPENEGSLSFVCTDGSMQKGKSVDAEGSGVMLKKNVRKGDVIFREEPLLRHDSTKPWTKNECAQWLLSLSVLDQAKVLALKTFTQDYESVEKQKEFEKSLHGFVNEHGYKVSEHMLKGMQKDEKESTITETPEKKTAPVDPVTGAKEKKARRTLQTIDLAQAENEDSEIGKGAIYLDPEDPAGDFDEILNDVFRIVNLNSLNNAGFREIFVTCSRMNHSCTPNVWQQNGVVIALRDMKVGDELLWCYPQAKVVEDDGNFKKHFLLGDKTLRNEIMQDLYKFDCLCGACKSMNSSPTDGREHASDVTRNIIQKKFTKFNVLEALEEKSEEQYYEMARILDELNDEMQENNLLCLATQIQAATLQAYVMSCWLNRWAECEGRTEEDAIDGIKGLLVDAIIKSLIAYGKDADNVQELKKDLLRILKGDAYGKYLQRYKAAGAS